MSSVFTNLPLRGEYRMHLNNESKKLCLLLCIVFGFHYFCITDTRIGGGKVNLAFSYYSRLTIGL